MQMNGDRSFKIISNGILLDHIYDCTTYFTYPTCIYRQNGDYVRISSECLVWESLVCRPGLLDGEFSCFGTSPACDRQTDRHRTTANRALCVYLCVER